MNLPIGAIFIPIMIFLIPSCDMMRGSSVRDRVRKIDWIGATLQGAFSTVLLVAITFAGNQFAWNSPFSIGMFSAAGIQDTFRSNLIERNPSPVICL
jgi:hypothetical protein